MQEPSVQIWLAVMWVVGVVYLAEDARARRFWQRQYAKVLRKIHPALRPMVGIPAYGALPVLVMVVMMAALPVLLAYLLLYAVAWLIDLSLTEQVVVPKLKKLVDRVTCR